MNEPLWELQPLDESKWGPSPLEDLVNLWVKLQALNMAHFNNKPKFFYITSEWIPNRDEVYTVLLPEGVKLNIFHPDHKEAIVNGAESIGWECIDYQDYSQTDEWREKYEKSLMDKLTQDLIAKMVKR